MESNKRRILLKTNGGTYKLFSLNQKADGSIYYSSPDFNDAKWIMIDDVEFGSRLISAKDIGQGKISLHASGITGIRNNRSVDGHTVKIKGNKLFDKSDNSAGIRHLLTAFIKEPTPNVLDSTFTHRESDSVTNSTSDICPIIITIFAIPKGIISLDLTFSMDIKDMENIPGDFLGTSITSLRYHNVAWFAYKNKYMKNWPKYSHYCMHNGFTMPVILVKDHLKYELEIREPKYTILDGNLSIDTGNVSTY